MISQINTRQKIALTFFAITGALLVALYVFYPKDLGDLYVMLLRLPLTLHGIIVSVYIYKNFGNILNSNDFFKLVNELFSKKIRFNLFINVIIWLAITVFFSLPSTERISRSFEFAFFIYVLTIYTWQRVCDKIYCKKDNDYNNVDVI